MWVIESCKLSGNQTNNVSQIYVCEIMWLFFSSQTTICEVTGAKWSAPCLAWKCFNGWCDLINSMRRPCMYIRASLGNASMVNATWSTRWEDHVWISVSPLEMLQGLMRLDQLYEKTLLEMLQWLMRLDQLDEKTMYVYPCLSWKCFNGWCDLINSTRRPCMYIRASLGNASMVDAT